MDVFKWLRRAWGHLEGVSLFRRVRRVLEGSHVCVVVAEIGRGVAVLVMRWWRLVVAVVVLLEEVVMVVVVMMEDDEVVVVVVWKVCLRFKYG